jgi:hypothetical protein
MNGPRYETGIGVERSSPNGPAVGDERTVIDGAAGRDDVTSVRFDRHEQARSTAAASAGEGQHGTGHDSATKTTTAFIQSS